MTCSPHIGDMVSGVQIEDAVLEAFFSFECIVRQVNFGSQRQLCIRVVSDVHWLLELLHHDASQSRRTLLLCVSASKIRSETVKLKGISAGSAAFAHTGVIADPRCQVYDNSMYTMPSSHHITKRVCCIA